MSNIIIKYRSPKNQIEALNDLISYYYNRLNFTKNKDKPKIIAKINELQSQLDEIINEK